MAHLTRQPPRGHRRDGLLYGPTVTFRVLYVFFVAHHAQRVLMHFRVTGRPTAAWITQQLREAFPYDQAPRCLILDRGAKYGDEVLTAIHHMGIEPKQIAARSPWQTGVAERFVSTARRDLARPIRRGRRLVAARVCLGVDRAAATSASRWARPPPMRSRGRFSDALTPAFTEASVMPTRGCDTGEAQPPR
jgi:hypothetical protein